jgi:hypothetical protein
VLKILNSDPDRFFFPTDFHRWPRELEPLHAGAVAIPGRFPEIAAELDGYLQAGSELVDDVAWMKRILTCTSPPAARAGHDPGPRDRQQIPPALSAPAGSSTLGPVRSICRNPLVVIPAFNEAASLPGVVVELSQQRPDLPILVVDDASDDGSGELLPTLDVRWLELGQHLGIGGAVRAGLRYARLQGHDTVVRLDADGQHIPDEIEHLLQALGDSDAVVGSRNRGVQGYVPSPGRRLVQRALAFALTRITRQPVTDPTSGFWAFGPRAVALLADHYPRGYSEPELRLFLHRNGLRVVEAPTKMRERRGGRSTLTLRRAIVALATTALVMVVVPLRGTVRTAGDA